MIHTVFLFIIAGLAEIGGGYLIWLWLREGKPFIGAFSEDWRWLCTESLPLSRSSLHLAGVSIMLWAPRS